MKINMCVHAISAVVALGEKVNKLCYYTGIVFFYSISYLICIVVELSFSYNTKIEKFLPELYCWLHDFVESIEDIYHHISLAIYSELQSIYSELQICNLLCQSYIVV